MLSIIWTEKDKILWKIKIEIMQHVLKMQQISLLPKYTKWISWGVLYMCPHKQTQTV
jgi:hypothetical protein